MSPYRFGPRMQDRGRARQFNALQVLAPTGTSGSPTWNAGCNHETREDFMALRPLRNATISFGLVSIPVRFYTATKAEDVHFHLLHESCDSRGNRKLHCPDP